MMTFLEGYITALRDYAWWKDGKQYVGCGFKTLKQAIKEAENEAPKRESTMCDRRGDDRAGP